MKFFSIHPFSFLCATAALFAAGCAQAAPNANASISAVSPLAERAGDKYLLPKGAGSKDGSSWANALDASAGGLQTGWDTLQAGQTLWVGGGTYGAATLKIGVGGEAGKLKTVAGKDLGEGLPVFKGTFNKDNPAKSGTNFISAVDGSDYWRVQDIHVKNYKNGIASSTGSHQGVRIHNFDVTGSREGISLVGGGTAEKPELGSHDVEISNCEFRGYTKRGIRLKGGNYDFRITDCVADAGGKEWATEPFHMGFSVEGPRDRDITYTNCVALNNYHDAGEGYWNADGFCGEKEVSNLKFINCAAFDNTDGGWDFKSENMLLEGCISVGNKRNYRFWGPSTKMVRCLSANSIYPGGTGGDLGLWAKGAVAVENSTFYDSAISVDGGSVAIANSIIARSKLKPNRVPLGEKTGLKLTDTILWDEASSQGENPQIIKPISLWEGQGNNYNSQKFGTAKGYYFAPTAPLSFHRTQPLKLADRSMALDAGTDENDPPKSPELIALEAARLPVISNAGFESGLNGWAKAGTPTFQLKTEGATEGQNYLTVTAGANRVEVSVKITGLVDGENYTLGFKSRGNTSTNARVIIRKNARGSYLASTAPSEAATWTAKTLKFAAPGREALMQISVRSEGSFDLDDFVIERVK